MMEPNNFPVLLFITLLSTTVGWRDCSLQLEPNLRLPINSSCNITSYDCSQITCSLPFSQEVVKLSMDIRQWQKPMTAEVTVSVLEPEYDWSATFTDGEKIEVSGFPLEIEGFAGGELDVFLQCSLEKENGTINFKIDLLATTDFEAILFNTTLIAGHFPETPEPEIAVCYGWEGFEKLSTSAKVLIATSVITFMILVLLATVFCCKRNRATATDRVKVKPPSYDEVTSTKTKVPMQTLINEV